MMIKYSDKDIEKRLNGNPYRSEKDLSPCCIVKFNAMIKRGVKEFECKECNNKISLE